MRKLLLLLLLLSTSPALAQPQTCPTRPFGTSDNSCASTAFVQAAIVGLCTTAGAFEVGTGTASQCSTVVGSTATLNGAMTITNPAADALIINSGAAGSFASLSIGRTATEGSIAVVASANQGMTGTVAGDLSFKAWTNLWLGANGSGTTKPGIKIDTGGTLTFLQYGTGILHSSSVGLISSSAVSLTVDITGTLGVANGGTGTATAFTPGSVVFAGTSGIYSQDNANFFWDGTNHKLGIGGLATSPTFALTVSANTAALPANINGASESWLADFGCADATRCGIGLDSFGTGNSTAFSILDFRRANGTAASKSAVQSGDIVGVIGMFGYYSDAGGGYSNGAAQIRFYANENFTSTAWGSRVGIMALASGTNTGIVEVASFINSSAVGRMGLNTTAPDTMLTLMGNTAATVAPTAGTLLHLAGADATLNIATLDAFGQQNQIQGRRAQGTLASKTVVVADNTLLTGVGAGWDGSTYTGGAQFILASGETWSGTAHGAYIAFRVTPLTTTTIAEAGRFNPSGGLSVGTTTDLGIGTVLANGAIKTLSATAASSKTTGSGIFGGGVGVAGATFTDTLNIITVANASTTAALCWNSGTGLVTENAAVGTCTVSDGRLKNIEGPIKGALDKLLKINGVYFTWKDQQYGVGRQAGVIAQDVEKVFPELVSTDGEGKLSADYQRLTAPIIESLREINGRLKVLENRRTR